MDSSWMTLMMMRRRNKRKPELVVSIWTMKRKPKLVVSRGGRRGSLSWWLHHG
jgi:hypothetical protein